jgi:hypothetical protein
MVLRIASAKIDLVEFPAHTKSTLKILFWVDVASV